MKTSPLQKSFIAAVVFGLGSVSFTQAAVPFNDNFTTAHNYFSNGVAGTGWDGIINSGALGSGSAASGGTLSWQTAGNTQWDNAKSDAALLYLSVAGDFSASVQITNVANGGFPNAGLLALDPGNMGDWAYNDYHFNDNNVFFNSVNGVVPGSGNPSVSPRGGYMRLDRVGTTFNAYSKVNIGDTWRLIGSVDRGAQMPNSIFVGLTAASYSGTATTASFTNFSIVPEPASAMLVMAGAGMLAMRRKRNA